MDIYTIEKTNTTYTIYKNNKLFKKEVALYDDVLDIDRHEHIFIYEEIKNFFNI